MIGYSPHPDPVLPTTDDAEEFEDASSDFDPDVREYDDKDCAD